MTLHFRLNLSLLLLFLIINPNSTLAEGNKLICLKTDKIRSVNFKKDFMIFEMQRREKFNVSCKGSSYLNFENPIIIEPQKMGRKICSNDVLKLRNKTCFIDKIVPHEESKKDT
tara:strand:+ start:26 stop:367 length:342 start_codon:yes stop_codon:yes gene_type:complete